ncbi:MAG: hypothetical protein HZA91_18165 [Verrucomicrobia bacterium]|nr:hypothetical protein [Verrucomicrobiota bacterium]
MKLRATYVIYTVVVACMLVATVWTVCALAETGSAVNNINGIDRSDPQVVALAHRFKTVLGVTLLTYVGGVVVMLCTAAITRANQKAELNQAESR